MSLLDKTILDSEELLIKNIGLFEKEFYGMLVSELSKFSNKNQLEPTDTQLARLKQSIDFAFSKTKYKKYIDAYLSTFDLIDKDNIEFYNKNKIRIENYIIKNEMLNELRSQTVSNLLSKNELDVRFLKPIENLLRVDIIKGLSYEDAQKTLKDKLIGDGVKESELGSHIGNITRDALSQYDGAVNNEVRKEFNLKRMVAIGSLIETSRPFCIHIKETKSSYTEEEMIKILQDYIPDGKPSEEKITIEVKGKQKTTTKGSGMIEFTDINNITINRGGYGCRHLYRWLK